MGFCLRCRAIRARTNEFTGFASDSLIKGETVALRHTVCKSKADDGGGGAAAEAVAEEECRRKLGAAPSMPVCRTAAPRSNFVRRKKGVLTWRVWHACIVRQKRAVTCLCHPVHFPSRGSVSSAQWLQAVADDRTVGWSAASAHCRFSSLRAATWQGSTMSGCCDACAKNALHSVLSRKREVLHTASHVRKTVDECPEREATTALGDLIRVIAPARVDLLQLVHPYKAHRNHFLFSKKNLEPPFPEEFLTIG